MSLRDALDRTLLLLRDEVGPEVDDNVLIHALTSTRVALVADGANMASHAAQTAFITAAILMARSGHRVHLLAPDVVMIGPQPPLLPGCMITELLSLGTDMLPGITFAAAPGTLTFDLAIALGDSPIHFQAKRVIRLNAEPWSGIIAEDGAGERWQSPWWPIGAMAAAALGAGEAFKIAMRKLLPVAVNPAATTERFAEITSLKFALAPDDTPYSADLGQFDCISAGAIIDAALYGLARIPAVHGSGRIIEPDRYGLSNLNRYMTLRRSRDGMHKADGLAALLEIGLRLEPVLQRFDGAHAASLGPLQSRVLVGVDDIPTRWLVQRTAPQFLAVGATTHWSAMASHHQPGLACAQCLHPIDDPNDAPIPTTACVSFWAGLLTATFLLRLIGARPMPAAEQQIYISPFRPDAPYRAPISRRNSCPTCSGQDLTIIRQRMA